MDDLGILAALVLAYALVSRRLSGSIITAPMVFVVGGIILGPDALGVVSFDLDDEVILLVAEITLVLILFTDATRIRLSTLGRGAELASRLLVIGFPLTIALGFVGATWLITGLEIWELAILAVVLAPTDAALGQAVVENTAVPARIRQALNVESGLNDGLSVPLLVVFLGLAGAEEGVEPAGWPVVRLVLEQIGYGALIGAAVGAGGSWLIVKAFSTGWMNGLFEQLAVVSLAIIAWAGAEAAGGNGFIAAFVGGLAAGYLLLGRSRDMAANFATDEGALLNVTTFFIFGAAIAGPSLAEIGWREVSYGALSLTLIRMIPVAIATVGDRLRPMSVLFLGWFGPRGIATIVLSLVVLESSEIGGAEQIELVATTVVLMSVLLHGVSAAPLASLYGRSMADAEDEAAEMRDVDELRTRFRTRD